MRQLSISFANAGSGNNATNIGWINFGALYLAPGESITGLYVVLPNGSILSFDISNDSNPNTGFALQSTTVPVTPYSNFGISGYTGINGNVALIKTALPTSVESNDSSLFTISNIVFRSATGAILTDFTLNVADLYSLNSGDPTLDFQQYITNGSPWTVLEFVGTGPNPTITITNESSTPIVPLPTGNRIPPFAVGDSISVANIEYNTVNDTSPIIDTTSPTFIQANYVAANINAVQGFALGISLQRLVISRGINLFK